MNLKNKFDFFPAKGTFFYLKIKLRFSPLRALRLKSWIFIYGNERWVVFESTPSTFAILNTFNNNKETIFKINIWPSKINLTFFIGHFIKMFFWARKKILVFFSFMNRKSLKWNFYFLLTKIRFKCLKIPKNACVCVPMFYKIICTAKIIKVHFLISRFLNEYECKERENAIETVVDNFFLFAIKTVQNHQSRLHIF